MTTKQRYWLPSFAACIMLTLMLVACGNSTNSNTSTASSTSTPATAKTPATSTTATVACTTGQRNYTLQPSQSEASYQVKEKFLSKPLPNIAVGKTNSIQGNFSLQTTGQPSISNMQITVNLQTLTSDSARRDDAIRQNWLQSANYPLATFMVKKAQTVASSFTQGKTVHFKLTGDMTIHNTTHQETFDVTGKLTGQTITGTATSLMYMKNYGFEAPSILGLLTATDGATITLNFTAQQTACATK